MLQSGRLGGPSAGERPAAFQGACRLLPLRQQPSIEPVRRARPWQRRNSATVSAALLSPAAVFDAATVLVMPFYISMIAAPKKPFTQQLLSFKPVLAAAACLYGLLLAMWAPLPQLAGVAKTSLLEAALLKVLPSMPSFAALFGTPEITALAWVHLVLLDLVQARWVYQDGQRHNIPIWHSAILCFMVGPLGLLCHLATKWMVTSWRSRGRKSDYVIYRF